MKTLRVAMVCLCLCGVARAQGGGDWLTAETRGKIDAIFAGAHAGTPGYAVEVLKDGKVMLAKGYGEANLDDAVPITPQTAFHLASVSKQFTAAALALLVVDGRVSLEDPVSKYVPEAAKYGDGLRLKHLVYMTSGLHEYTSVPRASGMPWMAFYYFTRDEAIRTALQPATLEFAPGTQWAYRNINYMLLTKVVEVVSGQPFSVFMQQRVFGPLQMRHSLIDDDTTRVIPHRATGYAARSDARLQKELAANGVTLGAATGPGDDWARLVRVSPHFGGSGVFTTLEDLARWDESWYSGGLGPRFTETMNQRMRFAHGKDNDAWGLVWREMYAKKMLDYSGGDTDTSTYMARFPGEHLTVICLSNMPLGDAEGKAHEVMEALHRAGKI